MKEWFRNHMPTQRRLIQLYTALLYNAHLTGFTEGEIYTGSSKSVCIPGFNCYSCPGAVGACPLGSLQNALASSNHRAPYYVLGLLLLFGLTLGRVICGFLCPLGLIQELLYKVPVPKVKKNRVTRVLSYLKYVILAVFVVIIPLWYALQSFPVPAFCKYICPAGTLEGAVGLLSNPVNAEKFSMLNILFTRKFVILIVIMTASMFMYRFFCRFLCPLGAIYGLFAKVSLLGVKVDKNKCTDCGLCVRECKMDIRHVGDHECIHCGACKNVCPTKAITWKGSQFFLKDQIAKQEAAKPDHRVRNARIIAWVLALILLAFALWYFNQPTPAVQAPETPIAAADDTPVGSEVGMKCPDFTVTCYNGLPDFALTSALGKVTVINFWATWCTPCCNELPYFQQLWETYQGKVEVIAIHSDFVTDDPQAYLDKMGYTMPFGLDGSGVIGSLGGFTMLPMTVILDQQGHIVYNKVGSVTYAFLESQVLPLLEGE